MTDRTDSAGDRPSVKRRQVLAALGVATGSGCVRLTDTSETTTDRGATARQDTATTDAPTTRPPATTAEDEPTTRPPETTEPRAAGNVKWTVRTRTAVTGVPAVSDGIVYVGSGDRRLYALETSYGRVEWEQKLGEGLGGRPIVRDGVIVVNASTNPFALDAETGDVRWKGDVFGRVISSTPPVRNGLVYAGTRVGELQAFDLQTGEVKWKYNVNGTYPMDGAKGTITLDGVAIWDGTVYVVSDDDREPGEAAFWLHAVDARSGEETYVRELKTEAETQSLPRQSHLTVTDGVAVTQSGRRADNSTTVSAYDVTSGDRLWTMSSDVRAEFSAADGTVYLKASPQNETGVYAVDARNGTRRWSVSGRTCCRIAPRFVGDAVYAADGTTLLALDAASGTKRWTFESDTEIQNLVGVGDDAVYFGGGDANVYAVWRPK